jgi:hypothetical protein
MAKMNGRSSGEDVAAEVSELQEKTDRTRSRFLRAEMQTCALALTRSPTSNRQAKSSGIS